MHEALLVIHESNAETRKPRIGLAAPPFAGTVATAAKSQKSTSMRARLS